MIPLPPQKTESPCEAVLQPQQFQRALRKLLSLCEAVRKHYVIGLSDKTLWTQQLGQVYPSSNEPTIAPNLCAECLCQNGKTPWCLVRCASKPEALNFPMKLGGRPLWFAQKKCSCNHCTSTRTQGLGCKRVIPQTKLIVEDAKQSTLTIRKELSCSLETWHQDDNSYTVIH